MQGKAICPLCRQVSARTRTLSGPDGDILHRYECRTCGDYKVSSRVNDLVLPEMAADEYDDRLYRLSAYTRERTIRRIGAGCENEPLPILVHSAAAYSSMPRESVTIDEAANAFPASVAERLDRFLMNLGRLSDKPGGKVECWFSADYPVAFAEDADVFAFLLNQLLDSGFVAPFQPLCAIEDEDFGGEAYSIQLTAAGWNRFAELQRGLPGEKPRQAFVAMWFDPQVQDVYDCGIKPAIEDAGYDALRIDGKEHNGRIDDEIIAEIRKSKFIVADFTGHRGGVYFEAGFAMGLGLHVIWTCRDDAINDCHFDTRQYNHIVWTSPEDLRIKLRQRIEATIGPPRQS